MNNSSRSFSDAFQRLYCDPSAFEAFSSLHPISFARVLPFQADDPAVDDPRLMDAECAYLAAQNEHTRRAVIEALCQCGLLPQTEATDLISVINDFDADFFETMGTAYANAGMFICALRWYREYIAVLESREQGLRSDVEDVYASVGYCLYSLGLHPETIAWSKCCLGPMQMADTATRALLTYESQMDAGAILGVERSHNRARYYVRAVDPASAAASTPRLQATIKNAAPFQEIYLDWTGPETPAPNLTTDEYPFEVERDGSSLTRHRMNLIFATCSQADALAAKGFSAEAKRLLNEVLMMEPQASIVRERLEVLV